MFYSIDSIDAKGRIFLTDRGLSIPACIKCGIASRDGKIYFGLHDSQGELLRTKWRSIADKKIQGFNVLEENSIPVKMPLFNMFADALISIRNGLSCQNNMETISEVGSVTKIDPEPNLKVFGNYIIITEGEFDCIALAQLGANRVVSLPNGANSISGTFRTWGKWLSQFDTIFIAFDMDEPGEKAAREAQKYITPDRYRRIKFPVGCKDANDWLLNESATKEDFSRLLLSAKKVDTDDISVVEEVSHKYYHDLDTGVSSGWPKLDKILGGIRRGELTVVTADTASGKSTFCLNLMLNLAIAGHGVWINSYEMKPAVVFRKMASQLLGHNMKATKFDANHIHTMELKLKNLKLHMNEHNKKVTFDSLEKSIECCANVYDCPYILLDHFDYIHGASQKNTLLEKIDECMLRLHEMSVKHNVHLFLVVHPKQTDSVKTEVDMSQLKGSSAIKQYADNILILHRMSRHASTEVEPDYRTKLKVAKNRMFGSEGMFYLTYQKDSDSFVQTLT